MSQNYRCVNNVSDEECGKCLARGFIFDCPEKCDDFDDGSSDKGCEDCTHYKHIKDDMGEVWSACELKECDFEEVEDGREQAYTG